MRKSLTSDIGLAHANFKGQVSRSLRENRLEQALLFADLASALAFQVPFGMWQDDELEQWLSQIAQLLEISLPAIASTPAQLSGQQPRIVHVTPKLSGGGGMRMALISNIQLLKDSYEHIVLNTASSTPTIDPLFVESLQQAGAQVLSCPATSYLKRAEWIATMLQEIKPRSILNYTTTSAVDFVGLAWAKQNLPAPIIRFNYGDTFPILGKTIADKWVEMRRVGAELSKRFRGIHSTSILPLLAPRRASPPLTRSQLGAPEAATLSLTISPYWKLIGDPDLNYFDAILKLLDVEQRHYHLLVCPDLPTSLLSTIKQHRAGQRFLILGYRSDLDALMSVCDFAIEGFPLIGAMVRLEFILAGLPLLAWCSPKHSIYWQDTGNISLAYPFGAPHLEAWLVIARQLIQSSGARTKAGQWLVEQARNLQDPISYRQQLVSIIEEVRPGPLSAAALSPVDDTPPQPDFHYDPEYICQLMLRNHPDVGKIQLSTARHSEINLKLPERWTVFRTSLQLSRVSRKISQIPHEKEPRLRYVYWWLLQVIWVGVGSSRYQQITGHAKQMKAVLRKLIGERSWSTLRNLYQIGLKRMPERFG